MTNDNGHPLPNEARCLAIMDRFGMPAHVIRHSWMVYRIAIYLTHRIKQEGVSLDEPLVRAAALLHDITKRYSFNRPLDHALTGSKLIRRLGYPSVASIVRQHVRLYKDRPQGQLTEAEVVFYADKRVTNDRIVSLDDRLAYIQERYARTPEAAARIANNARLTYQVEIDIFNKIPGGPDQVFQVVPEKWPDEADHTFRSINPFS